MTADDFARKLARLLGEHDPAATEQALTRDWAWLVALPPILDKADAAQPMLPPLGAFGIFAGTMALMHSGAGRRVWPWIEEALASYAAAHPRAHRFYRWHSPLNDALELYPNLRVAIIDALIAGERWSDAAHALNDVSDRVARGKARDAFTSSDLAVVLGAAEAGWLGSTWHDEAWIFARQSAVIASEALDERRIHSWKLCADFLLNALRQGATAEALALVAAKAQAASRVCDKGHETGNYHFTVLCVLAHAGHMEEAVAAAHELVRRGYWCLWRFSREAAAATPWTKRSGQLDWLAKLEECSSFQTFRGRYFIPQPEGTERVPPGPFRSLHKAVLSGKTRKRCVVSSRLIAPGEPVYRFRLYHAHERDEPLIAAEAAFDGSMLAAWRVKHEVDRYELSDFVRVRRQFAEHRFEHPDVARFVFDLAEGAPFDTDAFIDLIADPYVFPMRFTWVQDDDSRVPEPTDGPYVNDVRAGEFVNLIWIALKCGLGASLFTRLAERPRNVADPIFAMLATFERADCRDAAARHFDLDDLPAIMTLTFAARPSLDDMLRLADAGRDYPRFAEAVAGALARYNLHIYSNTHPQVDWWLQDLEHYSYAKGCQLLYLFAHCPERVPVLTTMLAQRWLVDGVRLGSYDGYDNTGAFFWRTVVMNRLLHAPDEVSSWIDAPWIERLVRGPTLRDAKRHVAAYRKQTRSRRRGRGSEP